MKRLFIIIFLIYIESFYIVTFVESFNMVSMPNKVLNKILLSLQTKNKLENLIKFSSLNNPISNYSKKDINNYLLNSKYKIIYNNFDYYSYDEIKFKNKTQRIYNVIIKLKNISNSKHFVDNNNNIDLIFQLVNEKKNKWRLENFYFNTI